MGDGLEAHIVERIAPAHYASEKLNIATPSPVLPASATVDGFDVVTHSRECGFRAGSGRMQRSGSWKYCIVGIREGGHACFEVSGLQLKRIPKGLH